jgi:hypothetical protein
MLTNLELRLKASFIVGERDSAYAEKRNDYRLKFRIRIMPLKPFTPA